MPKKILTDEQVAAIKAELKLGNKSKAQLGREYGVSRAAIYAISVGNTHKDIGTPNFATESTDSDELEILRDKLAHAKHQLSRNKTLVRRGRRVDGLFEEMRETLEASITPIKTRNYRKQPSGESNGGEMVLVLSDGHHDSVVTPEEVGGIESHDFAEACRRAASLTEQVKRFGIETNCDSLTIASLGDATCGEIHDAVKYSETGEVIKNCLAIAELYAKMLVELTQNFEHIRYIGLVGNHGRRTMSKEFEGPQNNFDYLIHSMVQIHLKNFENITFDIPNAFAATIQIQGHNFHLAHGDDVRGTGGNPFKSFLQQRRNLQALHNVTGEKALDYHVIGHHHVAGSMQDTTGELIVNGAWLGTDQYSHNTFNGYREPTQIVFSVTKADGIDMRRHLKIRKNVGWSYKVKVGE